MSIHICLQSCINAYHGLWGDVVPVLDDVREFDISGVQGHTGTLGGALYVVFQGSIGLWDWVDNAKVVKTPFRAGRVHTGFLSQYEKVKNVLCGTYTNPLIVTGHSLGAALAVLLSYDLSYELPAHDITCVTFGCPRVGDRMFAEDFEARVPDCTRVVNRNDIVTRLPRAGYWPVGNVVPLMGPSHGPIRDHDPRNYMANLLDS